MRKEYCQVSYNILQRSLAYFANCAGYFKECACVPQCVVVKISTYYVFFNQLVYINIQEPTMFNKIIF